MPSVRRGVVFFCFLNIRKAKDPVPCRTHGGSPYKRETARRLEIAWKLARSFWFLEHISFWYVGLSPRRGARSMLGAAGRTCYRRGRRES